MKFKHFVLRAPEGEGDTGGGSAAPAPTPETNDGAGVDWEDMNAGTEPGQDDGGESDLESDPLAPPGSQGEEADDPPETKPTTDPQSAEEVDSPIELLEPQLSPEDAAAKQAKLVEDFGKWEQAQLKQLTTDYGLDEEAASRLQTEPELVLPELAAKMHMQVMKQVLETVSRMMPQMVAPELAKTNTEKKATDFFYAQNSDLSPKKHHAAVLEAGKLYRKLNPKATPQEAAKGIGDIVRATTGLKTQPAAAPAAKGKPAPHRPVAAGARGATAAKPITPNEWADLVDDD